MATINQHFVPRFIIKHWCDQTGMLLRYDISYGTSKPVTPKGIFYKKLFYEMNFDGIDTFNKVEQYLGDKENEFSRFLQSQYDKGFIIETECDVLKFKEFIAFQLSRSKVIRELFGSLHNSLELFCIYYLSFGFSEYVVSVLHNNGYSDFYIDTVLNESGGGFYNICLDSMRNMDVRILYSNCSISPFFLLENPVLIDGIDGFRHEWSLSEFKYIFPVYPNYAIGITKKKCLINVPPRIVEPSFVFDVNHGLLEMKQNRTSMYLCAQLSDIDILNCMFGRKVNGII